MYKNHLLVLLIVIMTLIPACRNKYGVVSNGRYSKAYKGAFIHEFKTLTFCRCVENGNSKIDRLSDEDASCRVPDYMIMQMDVIDSIARIEVNKVKLDSVNRAGQVAEGMDGKRIIDHCLELYQSKHLEKYAIARFRQDEKSLRKIK